jgi:hypothetical protein
MSHILTFFNRLLYYFAATVCAPRIQTTTLSACALISSSWAHVCAGIQSFGSTNQIGRQIILYKVENVFRFAHYFFTKEGLNIVSQSVVFIPHYLQEKSKSGNIWIWRLCIFNASIVTILISFTPDNFYKMRFNQKPKIFLRLNVAEFGCFWPKTLPESWQRRCVHTTRVTPSYFRLPCIVLGDFYSVFLFASAAMVSLEFSKTLYYVIYVF